MKKNMAISKEIKEFNKYYLMSIQFLCNRINARDKALLNIEPEVLQVISKLDEVKLKSLYGTSQILVHLKNDIISKKTYD